LLSTATSLRKRHAANSTACRDHTDSRVHRWPKDWAPGGLIEEVGGGIRDFPIAHGDMPGRTARKISYGKPLNRGSSTVSAVSSDGPDGRWGCRRGDRRARKCRMIWL